MTSELPPPEGPSVSWDDALVLMEELKERARGLLRREGHGGSIKTTALVLSAFRKLAGARKDWEGFDERRFQEVSWDNRDEFFRHAFVAMRQTLLDAARSRGRGKEVQAGAFQSGEIAEFAAAGVLPFERLAWEGYGEWAEVVDQALKTLRDRHPKQRYADIWELKHLGDLTHEQIGQWIGVSGRTIQDRLPMAEVLLRRIINELSGTVSQVKGAA